MLTQKDLHVPGSAARKIWRDWRRLAAVGVAAVLSLSLHAQAVPEGTWLAFDVPEGRRPNAYVVGYFADATSLSPLVTYRVRARDTADAGPTSVRLPLRGFRPPSGSSVVVRVRSVVGRKESGWSEPTGVIAADELARLQPQVSDAESRASRTGSAKSNGATGDGASGAAKASGTAKNADRAAARAERDARVVADRVREDQVLRKALAEAFPGVDLDTAVIGYQKLENFVGALHAAKSLEIPLASLKPDTTGRRTQLQAAIQRLKPSVDARKEARKARKAARTLIKEARAAAGKQSAGADKG